jgi:hypothetical protein
MGRVVERKSKYTLLKGICAAVLLPGFGVPVTKWVESYYDVSFFSPSITALWNAIMSLGQWLVRDVAVSFWQLGLLYICSFVLLSLFITMFFRLLFKKNVDSWQSFTEDQKLAFAVVGAAIQNDQQIGHEEVRKLSGLSVIATRTALDVLIHYGLIHVVRNSWGSFYIDLTFRGQQQFMALSTFQER